MKDSTKEDVHSLKVFNNKNINKDDFPLIVFIY